MFSKVKKIKSVNITANKSKISKIFSFIYNFMFVDQKTKRVSSTKFWHNIGYGLVAWAFIHAILFHTWLPTDLYLVMAFILIGNRTIMKGISLIKGGTTPPKN